MTPSEPFDWDSDFRRLQAEVKHTVRDMIIEQVRIEHAALEEMIERMLVSPIRCGIAVVLDTNVQENYDATMRGEEVTEFRGHRNYRLDEHVPFGHIYEFPSMESYELWQERGWPTAV